MFLYVIVSLIFVYIIIKLRNNGKEKNLSSERSLPTAPGGMPIFGHLFNIGTRPFEYFTDLSEKIGPIYKIQIGWKDFIILNNNDIIIKCLKDQGLTFAGRWRNTFSEQLAHYCGLIFKENEWWAVQRSFTMRVLKDFGFGKSQTEAVIAREIEKITSNIKLKSGSEIYTADIVSFATMNVISDFAMSKEFKESNLEVLALIKDIRKVAQGADINNIIVNIFPIFKNLPWIENKLYTFLDKDKVICIIERIYKFISKIIDEHRERFQPENNSQDLIDAFLLEQYKLKMSNTSENSFVDFQLVRLISELFIAGFETTSTTLTWAFLILSKFPDVQKRMHEELVTNIGVDRFPTMADKKSLNYFQAVLDEILRFVTLVPLSLPHRVVQDTYVDGYFFPEDSIVFTNLYACHRDSKIWKKPYDFYPEHFLNENGKYTPRAELIPFGVGKRICLGESLAKMEYFIFMAAIIQKFTFSLDSESNKKETFELLSGTIGTIRGAVEHKIIFKDIAAED